ncbi:MAG: type IA DNA topoisomerase [Methylococcaceae bacterium]|nr:MAG: type IA DNA topoisomerase [Methylococcaceae bacterium]
MRVILTEKPSVARDIARCLKINQRHDGYFSGKNVQITWAFGHLLELNEPNDYQPEWKRWTISDLPIIPEVFKLKTKEDAGAKKQLQIIKRLFNSASEIICATDAGREGELIFRYILTWTHCQQTPVKRLWISSMTDEAILQGFKNLRDGAHYESLYQAARCRSEADWIVGLNATRIYTLKYGGKGRLWTIGRVQTPVLAMIVQKDKEIALFVAHDFWELHTRYKEVDFTFTGGRFEQQHAAETLCAACEQKLFEITAVKSKQETLLPPLFFDLTTLQKEMSRRYGFTAEQTLGYAQQLYESKHITYPRTDSRYLSTDLKPTIKPLLNALRTLFNEPIAALDLTALTLTTRYFNDAKVADHHAIIPTRTLPAQRELTTPLGKVYEAIVIRFIAAFYPPCIKLITVVSGSVLDVDIPFRTQGTVIAQIGWQVLYKQGANEDKNERLLPAFVKGETGTQEPFISQGRTTPPKPYNEASVLSMMESAGKTCTDPELKEALREKGLGTPATRAAIIETLIKRGYIERQHKALLSTANGRYLLAIIRDERLISAAMTGDWEAKLKQIERETYDAKQFMAEIVHFTQQLIEGAKQPRFDVEHLGNCPRCQQPVIEGKKGYGCSAWKEGCTFVLWKTQWGVTLTRALVSELLRCSSTLQAQVVTIDGDSLLAYLTLTVQGDLGYQPSAVKSLTPLTQAIATTEVLALCPLCHSEVIETSKAFSCTQQANGCSLLIWKTIAHKKITLVMVKKLLKKGETGVLKGFKSNKGSAFSANLKLVDGKVVMDFSKAVP